MIGQGLFTKRVKKKKKEKSLLPLYKVKQKLNWLIIIIIGEESMSGGNNDIYWLSASFWQFAVQWSSENQIHAYCFNATILLSIIVATGLNLIRKASKALRYGFKNSSTCFTPRMTIRNEMQLFCRIVCSSCFFCFELNCFSTTFLFTCYSFLKIKGN